MTAETTPPPSPAEGSDSDREKWDRRYAEGDHRRADRHAEFLETARPLLPSTGKVLDLAGGAGGNALWLASMGYEVELWDLSPVALEKTRAEAEARHLRLDLLEVDLETTFPGPRSTDVVLCFYYLQRGLFGPIVAALRDRGVVVMETYTREQALSGRGPRNPDYLLAPNELLEAFRDLRVLLYRELTLPGGDSVASIVARKEGS